MAAGELSAKRSLQLFQKLVPDQSAVWRQQQLRHLSPFDFKPGEEIVAVIGDSYVEARMNPYEDTIQAQLGDQLAPSSKVYGLGSNGLSIADYMVLSQQASKDFKPRAFVYVLVQ